MTLRLTLYTLVMTLFGHVLARNDGLVCAYTLDSSHELTRPVSIYCVAAAGNRPERHLWVGLVSSLFSVMSRELICLAEQVIEEKWAKISDHG